MRTRSIQFSTKLANISPDAHKHSEPQPVGMYPSTWCLKQGRNEGAKGHNFTGAESLWGVAGVAEKSNDSGGRRKVSTMSQVLSSAHYICFRYTSGSNMGAEKLASCPGSNLVTPLIRICVVPRNSVSLSAHVAGLPICSWCNWK